MTKRQRDVRMGAGLGLRRLRRKAGPPVDTGAERR